MPSPHTTSLTYCGISLLRWSCGTSVPSVLDGTSIISLGVLYAFVDVLGRLFQPITGMVNQLANLDSSLVSAGRVFELMDEKVNR